MLSNNQASEIKNIKRLFLAEIVVVCILIITFNDLDSLGLGGIIFLLPLFCAYMLVIAAIIALPILSFTVIKNRLLRSKWDSIVVWLAGMLNVVVAFVFLIAIAQILLQPENFEDIPWKDLFFLVF